MSIFSGKCDLCDHIAGMGGWYDRSGKPVKIGEGVGAYYSDEMQDFLEFKRKTGGVIYQHVKIKVTEWNQDLVAKKCSSFKIIEHTKVIPDRRTKIGQKEIKYYTYIYYGKEYNSLKELNKKHVYITKEIHFTTLLDIIPYYPYIIGLAASNKGKMTVVIGNKSYVDEQEEEALQNGWEHSLVDYYREELQNHYRSVVLNYFNPTGRSHVELVHFDHSTLQGQLKYKIDTNFPVRWHFKDTKKSYWTSPKVVGDNTIEISKHDLEEYLGDKVEVEYVSDYEDDKRPVILG